MSKIILRNTLLFVSIMTVGISQGQTYTNPAVATSGIWISRAQMAGVTGITAGVNGNSTDAAGSQGYKNNSATSSGTINLGCLVAPSVTIQNCNAAGNKIYQFRLYADWNKDGDFNDANETLATVNSSLQSGIAGQCNSVVQNLSFTTPLTAATGNIRFRWALREGVGDATPDGGYIGEIEDYTLVLNANIAPTLNNSGTPILNTIIESQTTNPGILISRLTESTLPDITMISDGGPCDGRGIAIIGNTNTNGSWEFKIGTGAWTAMGSRTATNALVLDQKAKIRFVPTGAGTATITFRAWDQTTGTNGMSANIGAVGGSTAYSSAFETATITVNSAASAEEDLTAFMTAQQNTGTNFNLTSALVGTPTKQFDQLTSDNTLGVGKDIILDQLNNNLYWVGGASNASFMRASTTGANVSELLPAENFTNPSGLVLVENQVYVLDNFGITITDLNGNFANFLGLPDPFFGSTRDIEYYGGKLYFIFQPDFTGAFRLISMNTDGSAVTTVHTFTNEPYGLDIANNIIYFTDFNGSVSAIRSIPLAGGTVTTLATGTNRRWMDLIVNTANSKIYFADMNLSLVDGYVKSIPRTGGTAIKELLMDSPVSSLALYRDPATLPVKFISVTASVQDSRNMVEWVIAQEENVDHYIVERSSDGMSYIEIGTVAAIDQSRYEFADGAPLTGLNVYRIKAVDIDRKVLYSPIVRLVRNDQSKGVAVYPTLVTNNQFTLRLQNLASGNYQLQVVSNSGQPVLTRRITHTTGVTANTITLPSGLSKGVYRVVVISGDDKYTTNIVVQ